MSETNQTEQNHAVAASRKLPRQWRWYHFYFVLALLDLIVIVSSLSLYHLTLRAYETALFEIGVIEDKQQWVASLRNALVDLNAPGNDVFQTRDLARERERFAAAQRRLQLLVRREDELAVDLEAFRTEVAGMTEVEERIFGHFESIASRESSNVEVSAALAEASSLMASMDRFQADALGDLSEIQRGLLDDQRLLLAAYREELEFRASLEKYFFAVVLAILLGMFWYGKKLQHTHDQMMMEQRRAERERQERLAAVGEVCSAVAHGIRNPLAAVISSAQLVLEFGTLDDSTKLRLRDILDESRRLDRRVTHLLDFSKPSIAAFAACDLNVLIRGALSEVKPNLAKHNIEVAWRYNGSTLNVHGDAHRLTQCLIEILGNCKDHVPGGGRVTIECRRDASRPGFARVDVVDDGPGIPESHRPHVFELFYSTKASGHGIGLASVKKTVELHGGDVAVMPAPDHGARFCIWLPLMRTDRNRDDSDTADHVTDNGASNVD